MSYVSPLAEAASNTPTEKAAQLVAAFLAKHGPMPYASKLVQEASLAALNALAFQMINEQPAEEGVAQALITYRAITGANAPGPLELQIAAFSMWLEGN